MLISPLRLGELLQPGPATAFGVEESDQAAQLDGTGPADGVALNQRTEVVADQPVPPRWIAGSGGQRTGPRPSSSTRCRTQLARSSV